MREDFVPYHYREYHDGRFYITEYSSEADVEEAIAACEGDETLAKNMILWEKPGKSEMGTFGVVRRCGLRDLSILVICYLIFFVSLLAIFLALM